MYEWTHAFMLEVFNGHCLYNFIFAMLICTKETEPSIICAKLIIEMHAIK